MLFLKKGSYKILIFQLKSKEPAAAAVVDTAACTAASKQPAAANVAAPL